MLFRSIFDAMLNNKEESKYTCFSNIDINLSKIITDDQIPHVHIIDEVAAVIPKGTKTQTYDKLHDYPYIKHHNLGYKNKPLDIIFLSNGEKGAEENYQHLRWVAERANNINIHRSSGVNGRAAAYHAAARLSTTPWFFAVFAKLEIGRAHV